MWECQWVNTRKRSDIKNPNRKLKWDLTQESVYKNISEGNLFGIVECDVSVPDNFWLRSYFAEMQPIFKKANISREDIGEFMYA